MISSLFHVARATSEKIYEVKYIVLRHNLPYLTTDWALLSESFDKYYV